MDILVTSTPFLGLLISVPCSTSTGFSCSAYTYFFSQRSPSLSTTRSSQRPVRVDESLSFLLRCILLYSRRRLPLFSSSVCLQSNLSGFACRSHSSFQDLHSAIEAVDVVKEFNILLVTRDMHHIPICIFSKVSTIGLVVVQDVQPRFS
jgi:hypothetical protein